MKKRILSLFVISFSVLILTGCSLYNRFITPIQKPDEAKPLIINNNNTNSSQQDGDNSTSSMKKIESDSMDFYYVINNAVALHNTNVCLQAYVETGEEFQAMGGSYKEVNGRKTLQAPYIWLQQVQLSDYPLECSTSSVGQVSCFGELSLCGRFSYAGNGTGFGHVNAYRYMLEGAESAPVDNIIKSVN